MDNKNITFVIASLRTGGAEKVCVALLNSFYEDKHNVSLIVLNLKNSHLKSHLNPDIPIYNLNVSHARQAFFTLKKQLDQLKPDVCLSFNFQISVILVLYKYIFNHKYTLFSRGINTFSEKIKHESSFRHKYLNSYIIKALYNKSDFFIAQSIGMKYDMINTLNIDERKIQVINNPYFSLDNREDIYIDKGIKNRKDILFVGSFKIQKNIGFLLEVMHELSLQRTDFVFNIVGDGELRNSLEEKTRVLGIEDIVVFHGFTSFPNLYYNNADVFVLGSLYEGFPNVLLEALSYGVPVVSVDCMSGPSDIIKDSINGYLISNYDAEEFSFSISKALDRKWDVSLIMSSIEKFKLSNIFKQYKTYLINEK